MLLFCWGCNWTFHRGQQISWLAARSINHKFIRLFDPSIPEKPTDYESVQHAFLFSLIESFSEGRRNPQPHFFQRPNRLQARILLYWGQLAYPAVRQNTVRIWYVILLVTEFLPYAVHDLASRFADGRLSTEKLIHANDEELAQMLIEVRGIGQVRASNESVTLPLLILILNVCQWTSKLYVHR